MSVGLPLSDHIVSQVNCPHPSVYTRTLQGQMCLCWRNTGWLIELKFVSGLIFFGGFMAVTNNSANLDIRPLRVHVEPSSYGHLLKPDTAVSKNLAKLAAGSSEKFLCIYARWTYFTVQHRMCVSNNHSIVRMILRMMYFRRCCLCFVY